MINEETNMIKEALNAAGYIDVPPSHSELIECYLDYVTAFNGDLEEYREMIENGEITVKQMCKALINCN